MIKIFNKILWGIKPPENKSDIWFDGGVFKIYRKGEWEAITIDIDSAAKIADILKNIDGVYQSKLVPGEGILLEGSKISVKRMFQVVDELPPIGDYNTIYFLSNATKSGSYTYINNAWEEIASSIDVDDHLSLTSANPVQNRVITDFLNSIKKSLSSKLEEKDIATINGKKLTEGGNINIYGDSSYDDSEIKNSINILNDNLKSISSEVKNKVDKNLLATINGQSLQEGNDIITGNIIAVDTGSSVEPPEGENGNNNNNNTSIDPELLEGFMFLSRDFNNDFNNDFAR